jgi:membrane-bound serine protease (ClpP class)
MKRLLFLTILFLVTGFAGAQSVISININGSINPASAAFISRAINKAANQKAECIIIHLNTPGGLLKSTRVIVTDILQSQVPVVVYVSPGGAHAGSAGVFITMAAHIAVMSPGTNIGAAHPVSMQGGTDTIMNEKSTNDAAAFIRTIAEKRKRNLEWAEEAVRKSVSITEEEALQKNVIDIIAHNDEDVLTQIDGKTIEVSTGTKTLNTKNASVELLEMGLLDKFLNMISDPNVAYILMMLGFYGMLFELYSPGTIFPGIVGGICLILAFYTMHTLPINYAGLALIIFGIILFLLEVKITSHGMLAIGGIVSLLLGSFFLFRTNSALEFIKMSGSVIISTTAVTAMFFLFLVGMGLKAQRTRPVTGMEGLIGEEGETQSNLDPCGTVWVHGEAWNAEAASGMIDKGKKVRVTGIKDLKLYVEQINSSA